MMMTDLLVVMALREESAGVFETAGVSVLYSGLGKVNAAIELARELTRRVSMGEGLPLVLNFGTAGSRVYRTGSLVSCHEFVQRDMDVSGLGFPLGVTPFDDALARLIFDPVFEGLPTAVCGSGDSFATAEASVPCDVLDMEAYALAKVCMRMGAAFGCAKYVSDGADHTAGTDWRDNVAAAAQEFLALYRSIAG